MAFQESSSQAYAARCDTTGKLLPSDPQPAIYLINDLRSDGSAQFLSRPPPESVNSPVRPVAAKLPANDRGIDVGIAEASATSTRLWDKLTTRAQPQGGEIWLDATGPSRRLHASYAHKFKRRQHRKSQQPTSSSQWSPLRYNNDKSTKPSFLRTISS